MLRYGNPIMPFMSRLQQFRRSSRDILLNLFFIQALSASIGLLTIPFYIGNFIVIVPNDDSLFKIVWRAW